MTSYKTTIDAIKAICATIRLTYSKQGDGRIVSAVKETEYLTALEGRIKAAHADFTVEIPKDRHWYDIRINDIPINLKLTTGGTDNAFNKIAVFYTITGVELAKHNMNYDEWFSLLKKAGRKPARAPETEYHYLAVNKDTGAFLLKSILDIHAYKTNPCNILQINWAHEFTHAAHQIDDADFQKQGLTLLKAIQTSIKQDVMSKIEFAMAADLA
jgi:hypothetical protein